MAKLQERQVRGRTSHYAGLAAEGLVVRHYEQFGAELVRSRWRCQAGEIDLIFKIDQTIVFVEVKSSSTHAMAAHSLSDRQKIRIQRAAEIFMGGLPGGLQNSMRLDVALVAQGQVEIIEDAIGF